MPRDLPEKCLRDGYMHCQPLHAVVSDNETTFVCYGLRNNMEDPYCLCFHNNATDDMSYNDELDLLDLVEVITRGLSTARRMDT